MKKQKIAIIYGLEKYGLTQSSLFRLCNSKVFVSVYVRHVNQNRLFNLTPNERKGRMNELRRRNYAAIV